MRGHPSTVTDPEMIVLLEAGSFERKLWSKLAMTRAVGIGASRF